ncbi:MAG: IS200/IS605 family transposase [Bacteroidetes bacterium]|nr:MAG: IS200/IS605 family transposase [Bacteroidota bacterium]
MKPGTFTQLYIQIVFAVRNREAILRKEIRSTLFEYMGGILLKQKHKPIIINGVDDHVHLFIGQNPAVSISDTVWELKRGTDHFVKEKNWFKSKFSWQDGFGAFSYSRSHIDNVYKYIQNQEEHHKKVTFRKEYIKFLKKFEIEYDERYLFDFFD